jgi:hypothetical protein
MPSTNVDIVRRAWSASLASLVALAPGFSTADEEIQPIRLVYRAPESCPSAEDFVAEVRRVAPRMRVAEDDENARVFLVTIEPSGTHGQLRVRRGETTTGVRDAEGKSCREVSDLLAFATALAIDASAAPAPPAPPLPAAPPPGAPEAPATAGSPEPSPQSERKPSPHAEAMPPWGLLAHGMAASGIAPSASFGGGASAEIGARIGGLVPSLRLGVESMASASAEVNGASVSFARTNAILEVCPASRGVLRLSVRVCARGEAGARTTAGRDIPGAQTVTRPWVALGPAVHARAFAIGPIFADLAAAIVFPVTRDRIYLAPDITVHQVGVVTALGEFALGVGFR